MVPAGYMAKRVASRPEWFKAQHVVDIFSVSKCMSSDFADYVNFWRHNGFWLFDSPEVILSLSREHSLDLAGTRFFYYEVHEHEFDDNEPGWRAFSPEPSFTTRIIRPDRKRLEGFDIVTFSARTSPECSPLSCNSMAGEIETNSHCLLFSFEQSKELLEQGRFRNAEPGPYRIFAVYSVPPP